MSDNPITDAFDAVEEDQEAPRPGESNDEFDPEQCSDALNGGSDIKEEIVRIAVMAGMRVLYQECWNADEVEANPAQSIRNYLEKIGPSPSRGI